MLSRRCLIVCAILGVLSHYVDSQWCNNVRSVTKTRSVTRLMTKTISVRRFFRKKHKTVQWPETVIESYAVPEIFRECCPGYHLDGVTCVPTCTGGCARNSHCVLPEFCECASGFQSAPNSSRSHPTCVPVCEQPCPEHSTCAQPNECICKIGYKMTDKVCVPICTMPPRAHEYCMEPEVYGCVAGYVRNATTLACEPSCAQSQCGEHSVCVAPEQCACEPGYAPDAKGDASKCQAVCGAGCPAHSRCVAPDVCSCHAGYAMLSDTQECLPTCAPTCGKNAYCDAPNMCKCQPGYSNTRAGNCAADCPALCEPYGQCLEPHKCTCHAGYALRNASMPVVGDNQSLCQPVCSMSCEHGYCGAPETCYCNTGYLLGPDKRCEPVCAEYCENGYCSAPNVCACNAGYEWSTTTKRCDPVCAPACQNGVCISPNFCLCHSGFEPNLAESHKCLIVTTTSTYGTDAVETTTTTVEDYSTTVTLEDNIKADSDFSSPAEPETTAEYDNVIVTSSYSSLAPLSYVRAAQCTFDCDCWQEISEYDHPLLTSCAHDCNGTHLGICDTIATCDCDAERKTLSCHYVTEASSMVRFYCTQMRDEALEPENLTKPSRRSSWIWIATGSLVVAAIIALAACWVKRRLYTGIHYDVSESFIVENM